MAQCKSFVSEAELAERRLRRQEEWEKVRKPEDPLEAPEEEYDPRSLYERLQDQKNQKQAEYEEAHRLKNMIRGLDDDEVEFLDLVDRTKEKIEAQRWKEEIKEIQEFRKAVASLAEKNAEQRLLDLKKEVKTQLVNSTGVKKSQSSLLINAVKRKTNEATSIPDKRLKPKGIQGNNGAEESCKHHKQDVNEHTYRTSSNKSEAEGSNWKAEDKRIQNKQENITSVLSKFNQPTKSVDLQKEEDSCPMASSNMNTSLNFSPAKAVERKLFEETSITEKVKDLDSSGKK